MNVIVSRLVFAFFLVNLSCPMLVLGKDKASAESKGQALALTPLEHRPAKLVYEALRREEGTLGFLEDINGDGVKELYFLKKDLSNQDLKKDHVETSSGAKGEEDQNNLTFMIVSLADGKVITRLPIGNGDPAGISAVNLDDDPAPEYIAAFGNHSEAKLAEVFRNFLLFGIIGASLADYGGLPVDLEHLAALDDNGAVLWRRDLKKDFLNAGHSNNMRLRMVFAQPEEKAASILLTFNGSPSVICLSGKDGTNRWTSDAFKDDVPSKWSLSQVADGTRQLAVFYRQDAVRVFDVATGKLLLDRAGNADFEAVPSWGTFDVGGKTGFLVVGAKGSDVRLVSLESGDTLWSHKIESVRGTYRNNDKEMTIIAKNDIHVFNALGEEVKRSPVPEKVNGETGHFVDLDGDGTKELVYVSSKNVTCWEPGEETVRWSFDGCGFVGAAGPVMLFEEFADLDGDGVLDVAVRKCNGVAFWLSGKTGKELLKPHLSLADSFASPIVGDWDRNGNKEFLWGTKWFEVGAPIAKKGGHARK